MYYYQVLKGQNLVLRTNTQVKGESAVKAPQTFDEVCQNWFCRTEKGWGEAEVGKRWGARPQKPETKQRLTIEHNM